MAALEERGHQVRILVGQSSVTSSDLPGDVVIVPPISWIERVSTWFLPRGRIVICRPDKLLRAVFAPRPDVVLIKKQGSSIINQGPHILLASVLAGIARIPRASWGNRAEGRTTSELLAASVGIMPRRHFRAVPRNDEPLRPDLGALPDPVIPYAVRAEPVAASTPNEAEGQPVRVLCVGNFDSMRKRPWWVIEAAGRLGRADGSLHFTFVGVGDDSSPGLLRTIDAAQQWSCNDVTQTLVNVPHDQMASIYQRHDMLVLPAHSEPFGMAITEAMAHGLPALVADTAGTAGYVTAGVTGDIFQEHDFDDFVAAFERLVSDSRELRAMGEAARQSMLELSDLSAYARALETVALGPPAPPHVLRRTFSRQPPTTTIGT